MEPKHSGEFGLLGGRKTGRSMSDYFLAEGRFLPVCRELLVNGLTSHGWTGKHPLSLNRKSHISAPLKQQELRST